MTRGFSCYACPESISVPDTIKNEADTAKFASDAGWCLGLGPSGQAHFACPDCGPSLYNVALIDGRDITETADHD